MTNNATDAITVIICPHCGAWNRIRSFGTTISNDYCEKCGKIL